MPGSVKGLRVTPCIMAPETPSAAPTSKATESPGQAQGVHDEARVGVIRPEKQPPHLAQGNIHRPHRDGQQQGEGHQSGGQRKHQR